MDEFNYSDKLPPVNYRCSACGVAGCKLWRQYNTCACFIKLLCANCAREDQGVDYKIDREGYHYWELGPCDQIEWLVPAVPTEDGYTYWGYTSVPEDGVSWWRRLPLSRSRRQTMLALVLMLLPLLIVWFV